MADIFDVIADPTRRDLLQVLLERYVAADSETGEISVGDLVERLGLSQPTVSKHLRVLREVGLVGVRDEGRQRLYWLNGQGLKPIHDWVKRYERAWNERYDALDDLLEELKATEEDLGSSTE